MASSKPLSSSIRKGQTAMVCQLCENDPKLKWKCLECRLMMCQKCRDKVHSKFASADDHTIIDIKDISKHQEEQKVDFTKLKCTRHVGQNCCLFCKPCNELVCPVCVSKTHNKHDMTEISEGYKIRVDKIRNRQKEITKGMKTLSKGQEEIRKIKFLEQSSHIKSKQGILDYKKALTESIEKHCDKLSSELDQNWDDISQSIEEAEQKSKENQKKLIQQNDEVNEVLQSNDAMKVFSSSNLTNPTEASNEQIQAIFDHVPKFVPEDLSKITLLHGRLEKVTAPYNIELKVINQITTGCEFIYNLLICPDGSFWINDMNQNVIQRVKQVGSTTNILSNFTLEVVDMTFTSSGDILLSVIGSSVVKVIPSGTEEVKDSPYNVSPLTSMGIHATHDNKVILGCVDDENKQVIILDQSGRQEKVFQYDSHNKALFTFPCRVTSTSNNNIGVIDWLSEDGQGRVVILNNEGGIINIYTGHPDVNIEDNPFTPTGIVTTLSVNFVISDSKNHTLYILSSNGEIITYYNTEKLGIELPYSLSFSHTGQLYIGSVTYIDSGLKPNIYKIDNFVW